MLLRAPSFYDAFACTADRCADSCCIGWEIDVDETTAACYAGLPGAFGDRVRARLVDQPPHFAQDAAGRCAFLQKDGLCELYCRLGKEALCDICANHPRFYNPLPGVTEAGLGLCCEEAARLLFCCEEGLFLTERIVPDSRAPVCSNSTREDIRYAAELLKIRAAAFSLAKDRRFPFGVRLGLLAVLADEADALFADAGDADALAADWSAGEAAASLAPQIRDLAHARPNEGLALLRQTLCFLAQQPPLDAHWPDRLRLLTQKLAAGALPGDDFFAVGETFCERVLCYYLYRWLPQAAKTGDAAMRILFALAASLLTCLLARETFCEKGTFSLADQISAAKAFSKEVEYMPGLPARLTEKCARRGIFPLG